MHAGRGLDATAPPQPRRQVTRQKRSIIQKAGVSSLSARKLRIRSTYESRSSWVHRVCLHNCLEVFVNVESLASALRRMSSMGGCKIWAKGLLGSPPRRQRSSGRWQLASPLGRRLSPLLWRRVWPWRSRTIGHEHRRTSMRFQAKSLPGPSRPRRRRKSQSRWRGRHCFRP